ncbi:MAG TPA: hypothetical protein VH593_28865 [Ktedonobacteraceae bacterium]|jgi:hypothetical protein
MLLGEAKDVVREHFGRLGLNTAILTLGLTEGRKLIEREGNFWWMRGTYDASAVINQQDYSIESGGDFDIDNFKDARALLTKKASDVDWQPVELGIVDHEELDQMYDEDDVGMPEYALIDNTTLKLYPPLPDYEYDLRLYFFQWTDNPTNNTDTDDLLKNYGMAVCYGAIIWGFEMQLKDLQGAGYWRNLLGGTPFGHGGEIAKLKRENFKRDWKDRVMMTPHKGAGRLTRRSITNLNIYCR